MYDVRYGIWKFCRTGSFSFVWPDNNFDGENEKDYTLTAEDYGIFLNDIFSLWYEDFINGNFISIRYFDNLIRILLGGNPEACDMMGFCSVNGVIEYNTEKEVCYKWFDCLYKMDTHKEMWSLSGSERHSTIDKAFMWKETCDSSLLYDKRILLVDDIFTTGATLESAARILKAYHPQYIEALTLASGSF